MFNKKITVNAWTYYLLVAIAVVYGLNMILGWFE